MQSIDYITYNDLYGGIYQSQVIDVVKLLKSEFGINIKLKAFVPLRLWKEQSKKIKAHWPEAKVYPILGRLSNLKATSILLRKSERTAICRGPLAFILSESKYHGIIYDGRAAVRAEVEEYDVAGSKEIGELLISAETRAVSKSSGCIAVSNKLVDYWDTQLNLEFDKDKVVVIPCTLSSYMSKEVEANDDGVTIVYSGGTGPWQSFDLVTELLTTSLMEQPEIKVLFLTKPHKSIIELQSNFPNRVERKWLNHDEVYNVLSSCHYGILIRNNKWTNKVASPVKFAEYLNAGLKVLISSNLGDFTEVVKKQELGYVVEDKIPILDPLDKNDRYNTKNYCKNNLHKDSEVIRSRYAALLQLISEINE